MAAQAAGAEIIPDVETNEAPEPGERNENGLTSEEQAEFDSMRSGDPAVDEAAEGGEAAAEAAADEGDLGDDDAADAAEVAPVAAPTGKDAADPALAAAKTPKTVNYSKYQRELKRANEATAAANAAATKEREDRIKLAARVDLINEALRQQAAPPPAPEPEAPTNPFEEEDIDPNVDYAAAVSQLNRRTRFQYDSQQNLAKDFTQSNEDRAMKDTFDRDARSFAASEAGQHFPHAYQFLKDSRLREICITKFDKDPLEEGATFTPQEVQTMVNIFNQEEKWVVSEAIKAKKSPSIAIMKLAKSRGFLPPNEVAARAVAAEDAAAAARTPVAARAPAPRAAAPAAPAAPGADVSAQLAQLRQNQEDGRSLSDGGGAPPGGLSAELILRLGDEEFAELIDSMPKHQLDSLMGRVPT